MLPDSPLQAFKAEIENSKDWFPRQGKVEMAIFRLILYVRGPMTFDPEIMANEQAVNAHRNGISYSEIRYFFNSYPDMPLAGPNRKTEYIRRRDKEFASWLDEIRKLFIKEQLIDPNLFEKKRGWLTTNLTGSCVAGLLRKAAIKKASRGRYTLSNSYIASSSEGYRRLLGASAIDQSSLDERPVELVIQYNTPREQLRKELEWLDQFEEEVVETAALFDRRTTKLWEKHAKHSDFWEDMPTITLTLKGRALSKRQKP